MRPRVSSICTTPQFTAFANLIRSLAIFDKLLSGSEAHQLEAMPDLLIDALLLARRKSIDGMYDLLMEVLLLTGRKSISGMPGLLIDALLFVGRNDDAIFRQNVLAGLRFSEVHSDSSSSSDKSKNDVAFVSSDRPRSEYSVSVPDGLQEL
jgi:hypothetical protein